jgi:hypothetical protein
MITPGLTYSRKVIGNGRRKFVTYTADSFSCLQFTTTIYWREVDKTRYIMVRFCSVFKLAISKHMSRLLQVRAHVLNTTTAFLTTKKTYFLHPARQVSTPDRAGRGQWPV